MDVQSPPLPPPPATSSSSHSQPTDLNSVEKFDAMSFANRMSSFDQTCSCCPYGYHIDLDFLRYLDSLHNSSDTLKKLKKIRYSKGAGSLPRSVKAPQHSPQLTQTSPRCSSTTVENRVAAQLTSTSPKCSSIIVENLVTTSTSTKCSSSSTAENIVTCSTSRRSGKEVLVELDITPSHDGATILSSSSPESTTTNPVSPDSKFRTEAELFISDSSSIESRESSIHVAEERSETSRSVHTESFSRRPLELSVPDRPPYPTLAPHPEDPVSAIPYRPFSRGSSSSPVESEASGISPAVLQAIREQMALSLRRMKELEEQVKVIPALQARISVLVRENEHLAQTVRSSSEVSARAEQGLLDAWTQSDEETLRLNAELGTRDDATREGRDFDVNCNRVAEGDVGVVNVVGVSSPAVGENRTREGRFYSVAIQCQLLTDGVKSDGGFKEEMTSVAVDVRPSVISRCVGTDNGFLWYPADNTAREISMGNPDMAMGNPEQRLAWWMKLGVDKATSVDETLLNDVEFQSSEVHGREVKVLESTVNREVVVERVQLASPQVLAGETVVLGDTFTIEGDAGRQRDVDFKRRLEDVDSGEDSTEDFEFSDRSFEFETAASLSQSDDSRKPWPVKSERAGNVGEDIVVEKAVGGGCDKLPLEKGIELTEERNVSLKTENFVATADGVWLEKESSGSGKTESLTSELISEAGKEADEINYEEISNAGKEVKYNDAEISGVDETAKHEERDFVDLQASVKNKDEEALGEEETVEFTSEDEEKGGSGAVSSEDQSNTEFFLVGDQIVRTPMLESKRGTMSLETNLEVLLENEVENQEDQEISAAMNLENVKQRQDDQGNSVVDVDFGNTDVASVEISTQATVSASEERVTFNQKVGYEDKDISEIGNENKGVSEVGNEDRGISDTGNEIEVKNEDISDAGKQAENENEELSAASEEARNEDAEIVTLQVAIRNNDDSVLVENQVAEIKVGKSEHQSSVYSEETKSVYKKSLDEQTESKETEEVLHGEKFPNEDTLDTIRESEKEVGEEISDSDSDVTRTDEESGGSYEIDWVTRGDNKAADEEALASIATKQEITGSSMTEINELAVVVEAHEGTVDPTSDLDDDETPKSLSQPVVAVDARSETMETEVTVDLGKEVARNSEEGESEVEVSEKKLSDAIVCEENESEVKAFNEEEKSEVRLPQENESVVKVSEEIESQVKLSKKEIFEVRVPVEKESEVKVSKEEKSEVRLPQGKESEVKVPEVKVPEVKVSLSEETESQVEVSKEEISGVRLPQEKESEVKVSEDIASQVKLSKKDISEVSSHGEISKVSKEEKSEVRLPQENESEVKVSEEIESQVKVSEEEISEVGVVKVKVGVPAENESEVKVSKEDKSDVILPQEKELEIMVHQENESDVNAPDEIESEVKVSKEEISEVWVPDEKESGVLESDGKEAQVKISKEDKSEVRLPEEKESEVRVSEKEIEAEVEVSKEEISEVMAPEEKESEAKVSKEEKSEVKLPEKDESEVRISEKEKESEVGISKEELSEVMAPEEKESEAKVSKEEKSEVKVPEESASEVKVPKEEKSDVKSHEKDESEVSISDKRESEVKLHEEKEYEVGVSEQDESKLKISREEESETSVCKENESEVRIPEGNVSEVIEDEEKESEIKPSEEIKSEVRVAKETESAPTVLEEIGSVVRVSEEKEKEIMESQELQSKVDECKEEIKSEIMESEERESDVKKSEDNEYEEKEAEGWELIEKVSDVKELNTEESTTRDSKENRGAVRVSEEKEAEIWVSDERGAETMESETKELEDWELVDKESDQKEDRVLVESYETGSSIAIELPNTSSTLVATMSPSIDHIEIISTSDNSHELIVVSEAELSQLTKIEHEPSNSSRETADQMTKEPVNVLVDIGSDLVRDLQECGEVADSSVVCENVEQTRLELITDSLEVVDRKTISREIELSVEPAKSIEPDVGIVLDTSFEPEKSKTAGTEPDISIVLDTSIDPEKGVATAAEPDKNIALDTSMEPDKNIALDTSMEPDKNIALVASVEPDKSMAPCTSMQLDENIVPYTGMEPDKSTLSYTSVEPVDREPVETKDTEQSETTFSETSNAQSSSSEARDDDTSENGSCEFNSMETLKSSSTKRVVITESRVERRRGEQRASSLHASKEIDSEEIQTVGRQTEGGDADDGSADVEKTIDDDSPLNNPTSESQAADDESQQTAVEHLDVVRPDVLAACAVYAEYLRDPTVAVDSDNVVSCVDFLRSHWFELSGRKTSDANQVQRHLDEFQTFGTSLAQSLVNMADSDGNTAMHYAVSYGNMEVIDVLLNTGCCSVDKQNKAGYTSIMLASLLLVDLDQHESLVLRLFHSGDVNSTSATSGQTSLMLAASHGRSEMVAMLLQSGAEINLQDEDGSTALMCASEHGHSDVIRTLLGHPDCDSTITDVDGSTALSIAMEEGHHDIGVFLYAHMKAIDDRLLEED